ncbi:MAG: hypothetical protein ACOYT4_01030 [Nanoarchaeota archaeon]
MKERGERVYKFNYKKAQQTMALPFGFMFALILIVIFIIFAFIAINHFLNLGTCGNIGMFYENFQKKIDDAYASQSYSESFKIELPSGMEKICFANLSEKITNYEDYKKIRPKDNANLFLIPQEKACDMPYKLINHLDIQKIIEDKNPFCIGKDQKIRIEKDFYDKFITLTNG